MKKLLDAALLGAGMCLGYAVMTGTINTIKDPCKKAKIKKCVKNIKNNLKETIES